MPLPFWARPFPRSSFGHIGRTKHYGPWSLRSKVGPMSNLRSRILAEVRATPSRTRRDERRRTVLIEGASFVGSLLVFFGTGGLVSGGRPMPLVLFTTISAIAVGAFLVSLAAIQPRV